jgi:hypothetical protein
MSNLGDHRISGKTESPSNSECFTKAEPKKLRYRLLGAPARHIVHARQRTLLIPPGWQWADDLASGWKRLQALHPV